MIDPWLLVSFAAGVLCCLLVLRRPRFEPRPLTLDSTLDPLAAQLAVIDWTPALEVEAWSQGATRLFGHAEHEARGLHLAALLQHPDWRSRIDRVYPARMQRRGSLRHVVRARTQGGGVFVCEWRFVPRRLPDGRLLGYRSIAQDLSAVGERLVRLNLADTSEGAEARRQHEALRRELTQARKLEALGALTTGVVHDFSNLLASIIGYSGLLQERAGSLLDARLNGYLQTMRQAATRGQQLTAQLLAFARSSSPELNDLSLAPLLKESVRLLRSVLPNGIDLLVHIDQNLPMVRSNPTRVNQLLMNLAINARDAMGGVGQLSISAGKAVVTQADCRFCQQPVSGAFLQLEIGDTGEGMDEATLARAFEPFFTTKEGDRGTGMGLAIVKEVVMEHRGHLQVESTPGRGTRFRVLLPTTSFAAQSGTIEPTYFSYRSRHRGRLLVVDGDRLFGSYLAELLRDRGHQVSLQIDGVDADELLAQTPYEFDGLITELHLPRMSGEELIRSALQRRADLPILICTTSELPADPAEWRRLGARGWFGKPLESDELLRELDRVLEAQSYGQEITQ